MQQGLAPATPPPESQEASAEPRVPSRLYALKDGDTFMIADACGNMIGIEDGLFHNDTRVLSRFELTLGSDRPSLLSASVSRDNVFFTSQMTNRPLPPLGGRSTPEGVIHIERTRFLWEGCMFERITLVNYGTRESAVPLRFDFGADFRDMFEVRGQVRPRRGHLLPSCPDGHIITFRYQGLDKVTRQTVISFSEPPSRQTGTETDFLVLLPVNGCMELYLEAGAEPAEPSRHRFRAAAAKARRAMRKRLRRGARLQSSNRLFDAWLQRSRADLALLTSDLATGPYPYAGIPWFSTPFGRDAIITALQVLWLDPRLAQGVLRYLASNQAQESSSFRDSQPGKIMHETRKGEMTELKELPFGQYYGGVDTTPLFVCLAGAYADRTGDLSFISEIWPALTAAIGWIERVIASDPEGFLTYQRAEATGLANQGWKDSEDSVFHADGSSPLGPIALVEVQAYAQAAFQAISELAGRKGLTIEAVRWETQAETLRNAIENRFWIEEGSYYAMALDGRGLPCRVRGSNMGHLLYFGRPRADRAQIVARQLMARPFNSGWGIRTLASDGGARFNPMSYHNGSVWPHDTAICAAGIGHYGERNSVVRLLDGMFEVAIHYDMRLPELFCGFDRVKGEPPVDYPVACLPQAWAAGSVFMMLQACLGLHIDGWKGEVRFDNPSLPLGTDSLRLSDISVGGRSVDILLKRVDNRTVVLVDGNADIPVTVKTH